MHNKKKGGGLSKQGEQKSNLILPIFLRLKKEHVINM